MIRINLRAFAGAALLSIVAAGPVLADGHLLDPSDPDDSLTIGRKIGCSTVDGEAITYWWHGKDYSRRQGERDKMLFLVEGMNVRQCTSVNDPDKGEGYKLVSREILLYKDAATGEPLATWDNPWTGETVDVLHVANDPVNFTSYKIGRDGKPATFRGDILGDRLSSIRIHLPATTRKKLAGPITPPRCSISWVTPSRFSARRQRPLRSRWAG